ncbi:MAG TPA: Rieske 2Fe-2S domain-containing protein [Solirubrobacteraceae bacterium]|nr:Rieske 2Fe-2S domain-containing protein [Solirubrobacteraceae bacterium]
MIAKLLGKLATIPVVIRTLRERRRSETQERQQPQAPGAEPEADVEHREVPSNRGAETTVALLLLLAAACAFAFTAVYIVAGLNDQLLGLSIGVAFALLAAAAIVAGKFVVPQETRVEERIPTEPEVAEQLVDMVQEGGQGVSRRTLLTGGACLAGAAMTTAAVAPLASLGPRLTAIHETPWHRGVRFVDLQNAPLKADEIQIGSFYTAMPEGAYWEQLGAPLLVVKLPPHYLHLPSSRPAAEWAPNGILAFSKICPHAACAISLYRYPTFAPTSNVQPAFTCPCHYSTFLPGEGGKLVFGPAGRPLPQLPVMIDADGYLRAGGGFDEDVGPAWFDVRTPKSE